MERETDAREPSDEPPAEIIRVEASVAFEQRFEQREEEGPVVRKGPRRDVRMAAEVTRGRDDLDFILRRDFARSLEFEGNAQGVPDQGP